jgi:hypothetical protein
MQYFRNKMRVGEVRTVSFDFAKMLAEGDSIVSGNSITVMASEANGKDQAPSHIIQGDPQLIGTVILQKLAVDIATRYILTVTVNTANGETLKRDVMLTVLPQL